MEILAAHYTPGRMKPIRLIVVHTMESAEKPDTAAAVARWFAGGDAPQASAHYCVDAEDVVRCVRDEDTAWHAPGANADGIGIEHAGRAGQGTAGWADAYSRSVLANSARLAAELAARHGIPVRHLTDGQLGDGEAGFVGHDQVSRVYRRSDHTDPGPDFPWPAYIAAVEAAQGDGMPAMTDAQLEQLVERTARRVADKLMGAGAVYPVTVDEGTGVRDLPDGRDADAVPTVIGEIQHEQRRQGVVLDEILQRLTAR